MKQHILIAILAIFTAFSLNAQVINNPSGNTSNNLYSTSICYVNAAPTWNPDVSAASKWCKIAYNEATGEVWYWQTNKVSTGNGAWVSASIITRMASNAAPSHTPPNPAEIVILPNGTLYTWNGSAWATVGGTGSTNLTTTTAPTTVTVNSDTGTDAIIPAATTSNAGVMTATDKTNLNSVVTNSHVPVTVTDGSKIDFTLTGQDLTATIIPASIANTDIAASGASSGQVLKFNGTNWVPAADNVGSVGSTNLTGGTQIAITNGTGAVIGSSPVTLALAQNGATIDQAMIWNGASWGPGSIDATAIPYSPTTPLTSTDVQSALDELALLSGGGGASYKDSTFSKLNGSYVGKNLWSNVYRNGTTSFRGLDTTGLVTIGHYGSGWNTQNKPMLILGQDTTNLKNIYFRTKPHKNSPYAYPGFGFVSDNAINLNASYGNLVYSLGPNCNGTDGALIDPTKPGFSINWETSWEDGGLPTMEWHEQWKIPDSVSVRLKSYTLRYPNPTSPTSKTYLDCYHTADNFRVKAGTSFNSFPEYWGVSRNRTNGLAQMSLKVAEDASLTLQGVKSGNDRSFYITGSTTATGVKNFGFIGFDKIVFGNGGQDAYTPATRLFECENILSSSISGNNVTVSTGLGTSSGLYGTSGNRFIALSTNVTDVFIGPFSGSNNNATWTGSNCVSIGFKSMGEFPTSAKRVISVGTQANEYTKTGEGVISIGHMSNRLSENSWGKQVKSICIGDSVLHSPNFNPTQKLAIENSPSNTPLISGDFVTNRVGINAYQCAPTVTLDIVGTDAIKIPSGTTAQRPTVATGQIRANTTTGQIEGVRNGASFESFVMGSVPATLTITGGAGSPESVVTAAVGSFYLRTDGGAGTTFYVKESGTGNTGWIAK